MKKYIIAIVVIAVILVIAVLQKKEPEVEITETEAVNVIKAEYAELYEYPSDMLPPKSIKTEKVGSEWYVAFIQNGSGRPYISARCFKVKNDLSVEETGYFIPEDDSEITFSPVTCNN